MGLYKVEKCSAVSQTRSGGVVVLSTSQCRAARHTRQSHVTSTPRQP